MSEEIRDSTSHSTCRTLFPAKFQEPCTRRFRTRSSLVAILRQLKVRNRLVLCGRQRQ